MGLFSKNKSNLDWIELTNKEQLNELIKKSKEIPIVLFKHSTRCSISSMAKNKLERKWEWNAIPVLLDLITYRQISNEIVEITGVEHQSPQAIVLIDRNVKYFASHNSIDLSSIF